jgi:hypothetical protein
VSTAEITKFFKQALSFEEKASYRTQAEKHVELPIWKKTESSGFTRNLPALDETLFYHRPVQAHPQNNLTSQ